MYKYLFLLAAVSPVQTTSLPHVTAGASQIQQILTIVFTVIGAIAVLMVVVGGLRYISAQGDPQQLSKAKGTLIYAIVGLLVSILAVAIVTFVLGNTV
jgi:hypothetical protein